MKRTMKLGMLAVVLLAATAGRTQAGSQSFDFSFTTDDTTPTGWIPGKVTGEIVLSFSGDGSGPATLVSIDTIPSGMTNVYGTLPINATAWDTQVVNTFTVSGGMITSADYSATATTLPPPEGSLISFGSGSNELQFTNQNNVVQPTGNESGFPGVTFTPVSVSVPIPEPSSLILAGMAGICGFAWRVAAKRRKARNHQNGA